MQLPPLQRPHKLPNYSSFPHISWLLDRTRSFIGIGCRIFQSCRIDSWWWVENRPCRPHQWGSSPLCTGIGHRTSPNFSKCNTSRRWSQNGKCNILRSTANMSRFPSSTSPSRRIFRLSGSSGRSNCIPGKSWHHNIWDNDLYMVCRHPTHWRSQSHNNIGAYQYQSTSAWLGCSWCNRWHWYIMCNLLFDLSTIGRSKFRSGRR
jgi:hypothetical protein